MMCFSIGMPWRVYSRRQAGFTLIELLTVMAIILVLAGLILSIAGYSQNKAAQSRAQAEIQALSSAIESYKIDNGAYPESTNTDTLNPNSNASPAYLDPNTTAYKNASEYLYQQLSGYIPPNGTAPVKSYYGFKVGQLALAPDATNGATVTTTTATLYIVDPYGFSYGYSTANLLAQTAAATANGTTPPPTTPVTPDPTKGYNPTFDLWSTSGYSTSSGKGFPTGITAATANTLWVKNW